MERWNGKVAIVTGASSGNGAAISTKLVEHGLKVVGLGRRVERIQELSKKLSGQKGKLIGHKCDLMKEEDIVAAFKWVTENVGPVSILINNAGLMGNTNLIDGDTKEWKTVMDTNVLALCIATREAIRIMEKHKIDGHIVHINAVVGHNDRYFPGINVYGASKHATLNLAEILRMELIERKSKIKISSVSPGAVKTEFQDNTPEDFKKVVATFPMLHPNDVADAVAYVVGTPPNVQVFQLLLKPLGEMV